MCYCRAIGGTKELVGMSEYLLWWNYRMVRLKSGLNVNVGVRKYAVFTLVCEKREYIAWMYS